MKNQEDEVKGNEAGGRDYDPGEGEKQKSRGEVRGEGEEDMGIKTSTHEDPKN